MMGPSKKKQGENLKNTTTTNTSSCSSLSSSKNSGRSNNKKCNPTKVKNCIRIFLAHLFSHVGLCILIVSYACAGAFLFEHLEAGKELEIRQQTNATWNQNITQIRRDCVGELWNITIKFNVLYEFNWTRAVEKELKKFEEEVAKTAATDGYVDLNDTDPKKKWSFSGALLYAVSIITTIGYGDRVPKTEKGKVLTMFYAVVGVPLMLLWLSNIGSLMANTFKFVYSHARCGSSSSSSSESKPSSRPVHNNKCTTTSSTFQQQPPASSTQVKYSATSKTCETSLVQHNHLHPHQQQQQQHSPRLPLKNLDPAAQRVLLECAEYNVNMCEDLRSRQILQQLYGPQDISGGGNCDDDGGGMTGGDGDRVCGGEEESSDAESVIDISGQGGGGGVHLNEINSRGDPTMSMGQGSVVGICGGTSSGVGGGGNRLGGSRSNHYHHYNHHGTPSKVPLLLHGESGPDLVDMGMEEGLDLDMIEYPVTVVVPRKQRRRRSSTDAMTTGTSNNNGGGGGGNKDRVPISLVLAFVVAYLMVGAVCFNTWEGWSYLDAAYFVFITLSTIGLGDLTPGKSLETEQSHGQLIFCSLFLVFGLAVISMSLNLMQQQVIDSAKRLAFRLGIIRREDEEA